METHCQLPLLVDEEDAHGLHANFKDLQSDGTAEESVRTVGLTKTTAVHLSDNLSMDNNLNMEGDKDSNATNLEVGGDIPGVFLNFADYKRECDTEMIPSDNESGRAFNTNDAKKKKKKKKKKKSTPTTNANQFCDDNTTIASMIEEMALLYISKVDIIKALDKSKGDTEYAMRELENLSSLRELQEDQKLATKMGSLDIY